jgi:hypothetical protein
MTWHVIKASRSWNGSGYVGPSSNGNVLEFASETEAITAANATQIQNPVGWKVINADTGEVTYDTTLD